MIEIVHGVEVIAFPVAELARLMNAKKWPSHSCSPCPFHNKKECRTASCDEGREVVFMLPTTYITFKLTGEIK